MSGNNAYNKYQENSIYGASQEELTLMLYNGLIKFVMQAQAGVSEKNVEKTHNGCVRAQDILCEFINTLDMKYPVSNDFKKMYDYMIEQLIIANSKKDNDILNEVLGFSRELRDTWGQAMKLVKHKKNNTVKCVNIDQVSDYNIT